jgi:imidazolonepropionase-like amidohydrolase
VKSHPRIAAAALLALATGTARVEPAEGPQSGFAIIHASVVPMDGDRVLHDQVVLVVGDRIAAVGPASAVAIPPTAGIVDARGAYVLPGLIDMHVHVRRGELETYVDNGITSVRNMWGYAALPSVMADVAAGRRVGPAIYSASPGLDGTPAVWPETQIVDDPSTADATVEAQVEAGWRWIKVYTSLSEASYDAITAAARNRGIRTIGHVPLRVTLEHALDSGQLSIEHLGGYDRAVSRTGQANAAAWADIDAGRIPALAARTATAGTWNCPTLAIYALIADALPPDVRDRVVANRGAVVRGLADAGARLLVGTDAGIDRTAAGTSIHDELSDFVAAGLTPYESLRAATSGAAEFLGEQAEIGVVAPGRRADLLIVASNPLQDVGALRTPEAVVLRGVWRSVGGHRSPVILPAPRSDRAPRSPARSPS